MSLTLAAVGAVVAAVLQLTIVPYLGIAGAYPDLLLVVAVIATFAWSIEAGMTLAFVGGLMIDLLAPRPIGLTAFTLLLSTGIAAVLGRVIQRGRVLGPDRPDLRPELRDRPDLPDPVRGPAGSSTLVTRSS